MAQDTSPLLHTERIVEDNGRPTRYFIRQWNNQRGLNVAIAGVPALELRVEVLEAEMDAVQTLSSANALAIVNLQSITLTAGTGLSGGGDLTANRVFNLEDTAVTPGSYTNSDLTVDQQGRITSISNGSGGGGGGSNEILHVQDQKTSGTAGGSASATTTATRTLNTVLTNTLTGASLGSNQITLPAGTYEVLGRAPAEKVNRHKVFFYNVTDAANALIGESAYCATLDAVVTHGQVKGVITIASAKVFELRHYTQAASATNGHGVATSDGTVEIYSDVFIKKIA